MKRIAIGIQVITFLVVVPSVSPAVTLYVPSPYATIEAALAVAVADDVIEVAAGTYPEHDLTMVSGVTLRGATGDPLDVIIDGESLDRVLSCMSVNAQTRIEDLTIMNGAAPAGSGGGGIFFYATAMTVSNCIFRENVAQGGAAVYLYGSDATLENCVFSRNSDLVYAGAVAVYDHQPHFINCTVCGNTTHGGGSVTVYDGSAIFDNCIIAYDDTGYGVEWSAGTATFNNCDIYGNYLGAWGTGMSQQGINGNFSQDPEFCWGEPDDHLSWGLQSDSPCAPAHSGVGLIGARDVECTDVAVASSSWGRVKTLYR